MPVEDFAWTPELVLSLVAVVVLTGAWARFRSRDIA
jgi:hypothetical protein